MSEIRISSVGVFFKFPRDWLTLNLPSYFEELVDDRVNIDFLVFSHSLEYSSLIYIIVTNF